MSKTIAVTGATGTQGGAVVNILLQTSGWKVRAVTRNPSSDKAKDLASRGVEIVQADFNNVKSLTVAFKGAHAIFAVTNFWEHLYTGKSQDELGAIEEEQGVKLAQAAAQSLTLEHYIWSTLPNAKNLTNGKVTCAHLDYKAKVDDCIKKDFPGLAPKTTFLFLGFYPNNVAFLPMFKPLEMPGSGVKFVQLVPTPEDARIPIAGDMTVTPGIWVRQILANPKKTMGKYTMVATEVLTFGEMLKLWSEVTGKSSVYVQTSDKHYENIWGIGGKELLDQLKFGEHVPDWLGSYDAVSMEELGITSDEAVGCKKTLESLKAFL